MVILTEFFVPITGWGKEKSFSNEVGVEDRTRLITYMRTQGPLLGVRRDRGRKEGEALCLPF